MQRSGPQESFARFVSRHVQSDENEDVRRWNIAAYRVYRRSRGDGVCLETGRKDVTLTRNVAIATRGGWVESGTRYRERFAFLVNFAPSPSAGSWRVRIDTEDWESTETRAMEIFRRKSSIESTSRSHRLERTLRVNFTTIRPRRAEHNHALDETYVRCFIRVRLTRYGAITPPRRLRVDQGLEETLRYCAHFLYPSDKNYLRCMLSDLLNTGTSEKC